MTSDDALLRLASDGDQSAFAEMLERYTPALTRYAWALMTSRSDVQDVVQETWLTAWDRLPTVRIVDTSMLPWLLVTCRNHALNARRRNGKNTAEPLLEDTAVDVRDGSAGEQLRWVMQEISELEEQDRRLCQLCLIEGVSYDEAARQVGVTPAAARKRIQRLRIRIRNAVTDND